MKKKQQVDKAELCQFLREGGHVQRMHTMPILGEYSVGKHSFDALSILLVYHPGPSLKLIKAVLWHDMHERYIGDIPAPAFWADGEFAKIIARLEKRVNRHFGIEQELNEVERNWLRAVDKIELLWWAKEQLGLGNQMAAAVLGNLAQWFNTHSIPGELKEFVENLEFTRKPDVLP